ncbi:MAG: hypothetical protein WD043_11290 [Gemmatimonadales bacterium]
MWAYAYEIVPPQDKDRLHVIHTILDQECVESRRRTRTWTGRLVVEELVTHILVVSDRPDQTEEINRRIEAALRALQAGFSVTAPMTVAGDDATEPPGEA